MGWRPAPPAPRRRCPARCPAECHRYRIGKPETRGSRRLRTFVQAGDAASCLGPDHLLHATARRLCANVEEALAFCAEWEARRNDLPYEIDGVVLKVDSVEQQRTLAFTRSE